MPQQSIETELTYNILMRREEEKRHHSYDEELLQYEYLRYGDMRSVEENIRMFRGESLGTLSRDPVRNVKYMFIASVTLAARFAIEGGMSPTMAYHLSDLYAQRMDTLRSVEEVQELETDMIRDYTERMAQVRKLRDTDENVQDTDGTITSVLKSRNTAEMGKAVNRCLEYVTAHLHQRISLAQIGDAVGFSPNYLNTLFRQKTGMSLQQYIRNVRIENAKKMLVYTEFSVSDIAEYLAFSSPSHFSKVFHEQTGMSPKAYQESHFMHHDRWHGNDNYISR